MPAVSKVVAGARVVLLDWDIQSLAQGGVAPWLTNVRDRTITWFHRLKPLRGSPEAHIEPAGNGYAIIEAARAQGLNPHEIDTKYVTAGKDARALMVEPHSTAGRVKMVDRRSRGGRIIAARRQPPGPSSHRVPRLRKDAYRREDDLFDAAMYAALVSSGRRD